MKILDFSNKDLFLLGDLHENFKLLTYVLKKNKEVISQNQTTNSFRKRKKSYKYVHDAVFCILGDSTIGMHKDSFYEHFFKILQELLIENDSYLLLIRGNHDDPSFFKGETKKFNFDRVIFVEDYTVLKTKNGTSLCVGGATSIDKTWRLATMERVNRFKKSFKRTIWWEDEDVYLETDIIKDLKENNITIDSILSHTFPSDFLPKHLQQLAVKSIGDWSLQDSTIQDRITKENKVFGELISLITNNGHKILWWAHGHYHYGNLAAVELGQKEGTLLISVNEIKEGIWLNTNTQSIEMLNVGLYDTSHIIQNMEDLNLIKKRKKATKKQEKTLTLELIEKTLEQLATMHSNSPSITVPNDWFQGITTYEANQF